MDWKYSRARNSPMNALDEFLIDGIPTRDLEMLWETIGKIGTHGFISRAKQRDLYLSMQGITFTLSGVERPLPVDLVPRVIAVSIQLLVTNWQFIS